MKWYLHTIKVDLQRDGYKYSFEYQVESNMSGSGVLTCDSDDLRMQLSEFVGQSEDDFDNGEPIELELKNDDGEGLYFDIESDEDFEVLLVGVSILKREKLNK
jgi:hypothetical protein